METSEKRAVGNPVYATIIERIAAAYSVQFILSLIAVAVYITIIFYIDDVDISILFLFLPLLIIYLAYLVLSLIVLISRAQSIGMYFFGLQIVDVDTGEPLSDVKHFFLRGLVGQGLLYLVPFYQLIDLLFIFRNDRRTLHDLIAGSIVVRMDAEHRRELKSRGFFANARNVKYDLAQIKHAEKNSLAAILWLIIPIAIGILGIAASVIIVALGGAREKARSALDEPKIATVSDLANEAYSIREDKLKYPATLDELIQSYNSHSDYPINEDEKISFNIMYCTLNNDSIAHVGVKLSTEVPKKYLDFDYNINTKSQNSNCFDGTKDDVFDVYLE